MEKLEPMDILRVPTKKDTIVAEIGEWIKTSHDDKENRICTIVFRKDTPRKILRLFERNTDAFKVVTDYTINKHYEIEE